MGIKCNEVVVMVLILMILMITIRLMMVLIMMIRSLGQLGLWAPCSGVRDVFT